MRRGLLAVVVAAAGCVTAKDAVGGGDARLDEAGKAEAAAGAKAGRVCGPEAKGDLVLLDARTGGPVTCLAVTVTSEPMSCAHGGGCPSDPVFKGHTNARGQVPVAQPFSKVRLVAVADGYDTAFLENATLAKDTVLELELPPSDGFWLKVLDAEGNYLPDVSIAFKQGEAVIAQLRSNVLANVFFAQRQPFGGQPVTAEAEGYRAVSITGAADLGEDGHTLVLRK